MAELLPGYVESGRDAWRRVVHAAETERDAGAVMIVVDRAALFGGGGFDRGDHLGGLLGGLGAGLPAGAEAGGAPDRRLGRAADPHRQIGLYRLWRDRGAAELVVHAVEIDLVLGPQPADHFEPLIGLAAA